MESQKEVSERKLALPCEPPSFERLKYEPLPKPDFIRLLQKHERGSATEFDCSLHVFPIDEAPKYTALSYTWVSPLPNQDTQDEYDYHIVCDGHVHPVTENLFMFLRRFPGIEDSYLWIDQICINQEDPTEKAMQVARMGSIFVKSKVVFAWLGEEDDASQAAYRTLGDFVPAYGRARVEGRIQEGYVNSGDPKFWDILELTPWTNEEVFSMIQFFSRPWFERAWMVHEVALANEIAVATGGPALDWTIFAAFFHFLVESGWYNAFQSSKREALAALAPNETYLGEATPIGLLPMAYKLQLLCKEGYSRGLNKPAEGPSKEEFYKLLEFMLVFFRISKATLPVDKIFAPLAVISQLLLNEKDRSAFMLPDYESPVVNVLTRTSTLVIEETGSLSLLSHVESSSHRNHNDLPSWVPDYSSICVPALYLGFNSNSSSLQPFFNALRGCSKPPDVSIRDGKLSSRAEVLWRTIICNIGSEQESPAPEEIGTSFHSFLLKRIAESTELKEKVEASQNAKIGEFEWPALTTLSESKSKKFVPTAEEVKEFVHKLQTGDGKLAEDNDSLLRQVEVFDRLYRDACFTRRMFRSAKHALGQGPETLREKDVIAFMPGATVPHIIRRVETGQYRLIGETYIHGFMHGEIFEDEDLAYQKIDLI